MAGPYKPTDPGRLIAAVTRLIVANGGELAASHVEGARVGKSEMQRYTDSDDFRNRHMPVDIVAALERACGRPIVTEFLAAEAGAVLLPVPRAVTGEWLAEITRLTDENADVIREVCKSLDGDGEITAPEAGRIIAEIDEDIAVKAALRARLMKIRDGGAAP